ncbi:MAG: recombinase family protein [Ethanoligenens sp.]
MDQYLIYLRKSRADAEAEARGEGETLARHEHALLELSRRQKLNVTQIYREIVSGDTIAARPVMQQVLSEVEQGMWSGVLVMEVERLARGDTMDQGLVAQTFKYSGTLIITPGKIYDPCNEFDEEYFEFGLFMSRREYKTINRRLQRGRAASAREGKFVSSIAPYGYEKVKVENGKGYTLSVVPETAEIVKLIFSLYVYGETQNGEHRRLGIQQVARRLNEMHIPPIRHDYWQKETIRDLLINPTYAGKIRWNWRPGKKKMVDGKVQVERARNEDCILVDGLHDAIVDQETFDLAQEYMKSSPPAPVGYKSALKNPLAGLIICGKCGRRMVLRKGYSKPDYIVCHCRACDNVSSPYPLVEAKVLQALKQWLSEYKAKYAHSASLSPSNDILQKSLIRLDKDIAVLDKQLSATYDLLEQGVYTTDQFLDRSRSLSERIDNARKDRRALENELGLSAAREEGRRTIIPKVEHVLSIYSELPTATQKNELLKDILEKVVYIKTVRGTFRGASANDFSVQLYPRLPSTKSGSI